MRGSDYLAAPLEPSPPALQPATLLTQWSGSLSGDLWDQNKKRFCSPWGRDFPLPDFCCTKSAELPSRTGTRGSFISISEWLERVQARHPQPLVGASQGWHPSCGLCQLEQVGSAGRQSGCSGQTTAQVICWWCLRLPVCRTGTSQSSTCLCHSSRLPCFCLCRFCKVPLLYLNPLKMLLFAEASQVNHIHWFITLPSIFN